MIKIRKIFNVRLFRYDKNEILTMFFKQGN